MKHATVIKPFTLLIFIFLITTFLFYRTGKFDVYLTAEKSSLQTSHNGGTIKPYKIDSTQKLRFSSSKVLILTDKKSLLFDTSKFKKKPDSLALKKRYLMSSSKSGAIFTTPLIKNNIDSMIKYYNIDSILKPSKPKYKKKKY
jgi:hypothetical protein